MRKGIACQILLIPVYVANKGHLGEVTLSIALVRYVLSPLKLIICADFPGRKQQTVHV